MRNHLLITLMAFATLIEACAPSSNPVNVTAPANTPTQGTTETQTPAPTFTLTPAIAPSPTATEVAPSLTPTLSIPTPASAPSSSASSWQPVIGLSVGRSVTFISCAGTNPVTFNGTITTNDSTIVEYDWLLRGAAYYNSPPQKANIKTPGTKTVTALTPYNANCGNYTVSLHIIYPNYMIATKHFSIP